MEEDGEVKGRKEEGRKEGGKKEGRRNGGREEENKQGRREQAAKALYLSNNSLPLSGQMDIQLLSLHWPRPHL
jgi:hypothetical protein